MIDAFYVLERQGPLRLSVGGGLTLTHAFGEIIQIDSRFRDVRLETSALGAGPVLLVACKPVRFGPVGLGASGTLALVFYDRGFPPGGDVYDFAWRLGPALSVTVTERLTLTSSLRWMHVSNGQGIRPQNPSYESQGADLSMTVTF